MKIIITNILLLFIITNVITIYSAPKYEVLNNVYIFTKIPQKAETNNNIKLKKGYRLFSLNNKCVFFDPPYFKGLAEGTNNKLYYLEGFENNNMTEFINNATRQSIFCFNNCKKRNKILNLIYITNYFGCEPITNESELFILQPEYRLPNASYFENAIISNICNVSKMKNEPDCNKYVNKRKKREIEIEVKKALEIMKYQRIRDHNIYFAIKYNTAFDNIFVEGFQISFNENNVIEYNYRILYPKINDNLRIYRLKLNDIFEKRNGCYFNNMDEESYINKKIQEIDEKYMKKTLTSPEK